MKTRVSPSRTRNWNVGVLLRSPPQGRIGYDRRHFHQLFHQLRDTHRGAHRDVIEQDLGHVDSLLGNRLKLVEEAHDVRQLIHQLRHRNIQNLYHGSVSGGLLHGAQLILVLWPPRLTQTGWPGTLGERRLRNVAVKYNSCLSPGPCRLLALCAMVRRLGKGHGDAHPFMPQHGTEASLSLLRRALPVPPPASRSTSIINR